MANPVKIKAIVSSVKKFGDGVYEVIMKSKSLVPRYKAGQFLHLSIDNYDPAGGFWPESRVFSIASSWGTSEIKIVYSVKGMYTKRMEEKLQLGTEVWLKLPYGNFIIEETLTLQQDVVLIAGGTGISPFLPYIENELIKKENNHKIALFYGARKNDMLLSMDLLEKSAIQGLTTYIYIEEEKPACAKEITAILGRLDIFKIIHNCSSMNDPAFFLSGPPQMILSFKQALETGGILHEKFLWMNGSRNG